jgi:VWFA-related protein
MTKRLVLSVAAAAALSTGVLWAQQAAAPAPAAPQDATPPVIFRVEVDYVEADVLVTDAQGNPVNDLKADEFEVLEDGKPQKVTSFALVNIPIERAERPLFATAPLEQDVQTNDHIEGRIYLIVLDDLHTEFTRTPRVKAAMRRFFERSFGTNDLAAIVFTGRSNGSQDFTNNPRLLMAAVDKFVGRKLPSATINKIEGVRVNPDTGGLQVGDDKDMMERSFNARNAMGTVRKLAEFMANVRGRRKALLLVGEGVDFDIHEAVGLAGSTASAVLLDTHDAIASATRGNVSIYAIDPRGLSTGSEDLITQSSTFPEQGAGLNSLQNELRLSQDSLRVLAANTGGFAALNRNDFNSAFDRIVQENSQYYLLGYYSTNSRRDGRYRKIQVRVTRPGLRVVRARNGYYEARGRRPADPAPGTNPALTSAIASPLPVAGMPVKVFAGAYKGEAPNAAVAVVIELDASKLDFVEANGTFNESLEIANAATNSTGKVFPGERSTAKLALKPDTYKSARENGFRLLTQMNLPPGKYQLRLAAANASGKAGSVLYDLEIPDFYKDSFAMSGVAITSVAASLTPTVRAKNPLGDFLPGPPVATREFTAGDTLMFFTEFYENGANNPHKVDLKAELRAGDGRVVLTASEERESGEVKGGGGYGFAGRLPLSDLTPGLYVLHVEGKSRVGTESVASRDIQIRIK